MGTVALTDQERELADELCRRLAEKHGFGKRARLELVVEDLRVVEAWAHVQISRGGPATEPAGL